MTSKVIGYVTRKDEGERMSGWQRMGCSVMSLAFGWFAFDFVLLALRDMNLSPETLGKDSLPHFFRGIGVLIVFFLLLAVYFWFLRKLSGNLTIVEYDKLEEKPKFRHKWFDILLQGGILATGFLARFAFVMIVYLPNLD